MIKTATKSDYTQIRNVWDKSFLDEKTFSDWFFENIYLPENTLVYLENEKIVSCVQRIPLKLKNSQSITYIYGACTLPSYRGNSYMSKLLDFSEELDKQNNICASLLIPQEESLFNYYKRFGYNKMTNINICTENKINVENNNFIFIKATFNDINQMDRLYTDILKDKSYIIRNYDFWKNQFDLFRLLGGDIYLLKQNDEIFAYAFVSKEDTVIIQEIIYKFDQHKKILINKIMDIYKIDNITVQSIQSENTKKLGSFKTYTNNFDEELIANLLYN